MGDDCAELRRISTNNLKGVSVRIPHQGLTLIVGPSGSGKSSLAYDTLAQIGQHEYLSMCAEELADASYKLEGYSGMLATVPLKQSCLNTNTHSTIGTYFGLNREIVLIYSTLLGLPDDYFVLNKASNLCPTCHGLGVIRSVDANKIIDYGTPLRNDPIKCWNRNKDFYAQMIDLFCQSVNIDSGKTFRQLSHREREMVLRGESSAKFSVRYKKVNRMASRTSRYYGALTGTPMLPQFSISEAFYSDVVCPECGGRRYSKDHETRKVEGVSIGSLMTMPFKQLVVFISTLYKKHSKSNLSGALQHVLSFVAKANELNLGHLNLNRGIPTLSGGELQRLRLAQVFNTQLTNLMIILDEPLAGISPSEKKVIYGNVVSLSKRHAVVVVDHGDQFRSVAKHILALGTGGGDSGGYLVDSSEYFSKQTLSSSVHLTSSNKIAHVEVFNDIYGYHGAELDVEMEGMTLLSGRSGVGKSVLLRDFLPLRFESYDYINQKYLVAGKQSSVATAMDVSMPLSEFFAKRFSKPKQFFSKQFGCPGACPVCNGYGFLEFNDAGSIQVSCPECGGSGFHHQLDQLRIDGVSLPDVWGMTIEKAIPVYEGFHLFASDILKTANYLFLGHLHLDQRTSTLSGGENIRVKLLKAYRSKSLILGIDEPFRGLDRIEQSRMLDFLSRLTANGKTLLVIDHTEGIGKFFTSRYEIISEEGILRARPN